PEQPLYLGAIVDLPRSQMELREDNNVRADFLMGVGLKPDLIITSLTAPTHVAPGQAFTATARVCNVGTEPSPNVPVELYLSTEPTLAVVQGAPPPGRAPVGMFQAPGLAPGECALRSVSAWAVVPPQAPMPNPTLYVGALVDPQASFPELREDNNASPVSRIGVAVGPDLVVRSVLNTPSARPGTSFQTSVQVCNEGTASATYTTLGLFLSTESDFTVTQGVPPPTLVRVGSVNVMPLGQGQCSTVPSMAQAQVPPESVPGRPLYLGAVADVSLGLTELREDNNVRSAPMSVGNGPDLAVREVTGPRSVMPGAPLTLVVTVCNMGMDLAPPTPVMAVLTSDATLSVSAPNPGTSTDSMVGTANTPSLGSGQCSAVNVAGYANPPPGLEPEAPRFLGARVDFPQQLTELREDNNTLVGPRVGVGSGPDLVVRALTAPASIPSGASFTAQVKVCNEGTAALNSTVPVDLIISSEPVAYVPGQGSAPYTQLQLPVGNQPVSSLGVNQCTTLSIPAYASRPSSPASAFYLGAIVDAPGSRWELREDNNSFMLPTPTVMP
ncbi:CARDB domain-containing protein, partial [Corallococcus sp. CA031C]